MGEQLAMFDPTGPEFLALAQKHEKAAQQARTMAQLYDVRGWGAVAHTLYKQAHQAERSAAELTMLGEFEALGGVA